MKPIRVDGLTNGKPTIMPPMILACSESSRDSARTQLKHAGYGPSAFSVSLIFSVMKPVRLVPRKMEGWGHEMCGRVATAACTTCTTCTRFVLAQSLGVFHSRPTAVSMPVRCVIALRGRPTQGTAQGDKGRAQAMKPPSCPGRGGWLHGCCDRAVSGVKTLRARQVLAGGVRRVGRA